MALVGCGSQDASVVTAGTMSSTAAPGLTQPPLATSTTEPKPWVMLVYPGAKSLLLGESIRFEVWKSVEGSPYEELLFPALRSMDASVAAVQGATVRGVAEGKAYVVVGDEPLTCRVEIVVHPDREASEDRPSGPLSESPRHTDGRLVVSALGSIDREAGFLVEGQVQNVSEEPISLSLSDFSLVTRDGAQHLPDEVELGGSFDSRVAVMPGLFAAFRLRFSEVIREGGSVAYLSFYDGISPRFRVILGRSRGGGGTW